MRSSISKAHADASLDSNLMLAISHAAQCSKKDLQKANLAIAIHSLEIFSSFKVATRSCSVSLTKMAQAPISADELLASISHMLMPLKIFRNSHALFNGLFGSSYCYRLLANADMLF